MTSTAPMTKTAAELVQERVRRSRTSRQSRPTTRSRPATAVAVDVREPVEWEHHIEGALQMPRGLLEFAADPTSPRHVAELDPHRRVIVYCRSGSAPRSQARHCKTLGFENVANIDGGFSAWKEEGLPTDEHHADL